MNQAEKEQYLRDYSILKSKGKPFYPYAMAKDSIMAAITVLLIVFLSILFGAELGPKADPTTTTYVPRPEWYFFFLFELLRIIKPPDLTPLATIGIPTICMILIVLLPFVDRSPERRPERRPVATAAGIFTIAAMAYLTYLGAAAGSPNEIEYQVAPEYEAGKLVAAQSGCLACHKIGENGNDGPGPELTEIGNVLPWRRSSARSRTRRRRCRPTRSSTRRRRRTWWRSSPSSRVSPKALSSGTLEEGQVRAMFDRIAGVYDVMNSVMTAGLHHRWRERAVDLARVGPGSRALDVATGTGDLAIALARRGADVVGSDFSEGMLERARAKSSAVRWEHGNALALRIEDSCRRRDRRVRRAELLGPGAGAARDDARGAARRPGRGARDHHADATALVDLLLALVRSHRATARTRHRRGPGVLVPAELGEALPGPARARRRDGRARA